MSRCRHEYTRTITRSTGRQVWSSRRDGPMADAAKWTCRDCGATLPLGPATDTPETAVEVRAAELAVSTRREEWNLADEHGWRLNLCDRDLPGDGESEAGWLAREIWTHEQETP